MAEIGAVGWARRFPAGGEVRAGRDWAREHLAALGWDEAAPDVTDPVVLAVSELVTNAHLHARSDAELVLAWDGRCLLLSVHDRGPQLPRPRTTAPQELGGRGLALVEAVADHWQTRPGPGWETVTAPASIPRLRPVGPSHQDALSRPWAWRTAPGQQDRGTVAACDEADERAGPDSLTEKGVLGERMVAGAAGGRATT